MTDTVKDVVEPANTRFVSKPVEIEAHRIGIDPWPDAAWEAVTRNEIRLYDCGKPDGYIIVRTLEGEMRGNHGDWLIRGTEGEFYPCKPSVFERNYEPFDRLRSLAGSVPEGQFLLDRLSELDFSGCDDDFVRDWFGHVDPAISRFQAAISTPPVASSPVAPVAETVVSSDADDMIDQLNVLCEDFGCEAGSNRLHWLHERLTKLSELEAASQEAQPNQACLAEARAALLGDLKYAFEVLYDCRKSGAYIPDFVFNRIKASLKKDAKDAPVAPLDAAIEALKAAERAHDIHANCEDCMESASDPVSCEHCFPSWNEAYELRQVALKQENGDNG